MSAGKPFLLICWLCKAMRVVRGQRAAEETADAHSLKKHRRLDWFPFMEVESIESVANSYDVWSKGVAE